MGAPTRDTSAAPERTETPLELAATLPRRPSEELMDVEERRPQPRRPVKHPKLPGGATNLMLWGFAAIGFVAVCVGSVWLWKRHAAPPAEAPPPKPVVYRPLPVVDDVLVTIEVPPRAARRARLLLDGGPLPSNPLLLKRGSVHRVDAIASGFQPASVEITADAAKTVRLDLRRAR
jgi:hypothetical protein